MILCAVRLRRVASARCVKRLERANRGARDVMLVGEHGRDVSVPYARGPTKNTAAARFVYGVVALGFPPTDTIGGNVHRSRRVDNGRPVGRRPHAQPSRRTGRRVKSPRRAHPIRTATRTPTGADARAHEICTYVIILISRVFVVIPPLRLLSACTRATCNHTISSRPSRNPRGLQHSAVVVVRTYNIRARVCVCVSMCVCACACVRSRVLNLLLAAVSPSSLPPHSITVADMMDAESRTRW